MGGSNKDARKRPIKLSLNEDMVEKAWASGISVSGLAKRRQGDRLA